VAVATDNTNGLLSYEVDGPILKIVGAPNATSEERLALYDAARSDPRVPVGALLLLDARQSPTDLTREEVRDRVAFLMERLGLKVGPLCAVIVSAGGLRQATELQLVGQEQFKMRVGVFENEQAARNWLLTSQRDRGE
jgi:hypothetical protein